MILFELLIVDIEHFPYNFVPYEGFTNYKSIESFSEQKDRELKRIRNQKFRNKLMLSQEECRRLHQNLYLSKKASDKDTVEGFKNSKKAKNSKKVKNTKKVKNNKKAKNAKKLAKKLKKVKDDLSAYEDTENFDDEVQEDYMDLGTTFMEAYKNLSPRQIEAMTKDTRELIGTQNKLIETLSNLGPAISSGKKVMEQFKHYFKDEL